MNMRVNEGVSTLTDKEKQTLRLIVRGHDAKSIARSLDLSVYTVNERLRDARRKMAVSSSREAARLLLAAEGDRAASHPPQSVGDKKIGEDASDRADDDADTPIRGAGQRLSRPGLIAGALLMTFFLGILALAALPHLASTASEPPIPAPAATNPEVVAVARQWLTLVDQGRWDASYQGTGASFRRINTAQVWADVSEKVRAPLGQVLSRTFLAQEELPAPPHGYEVVKFRTRFTNRAAAVETVTLEREDGVWRVVAIIIE